MNNTSIILITNYSKESMLLAQRISSYIMLKGIVIEKKVPNKSSLLINLVKLFIGNNLLELILILTKKKETRKILLLEKKLKTNAKKAFFNNYTKLEWPKVPMLTTENANNTKSTNFISSLKPNIIFIWGTGIIKKKIIKIPTDGIINAHFSKLPYYKGAFSEFWICYNNDYEKSGVTFHFVDEKIDSGKIIEFIPNNYIQNPFEMRYSNIQLLLTYSTKIIEKIISNNISPQVQPNIKELKVYKFSEITITKKQKVYLKY